jgi:hypothetical protein
MPSGLYKFGDWIYIVPLAALGLVLGVYGFMTCPDCGTVGLVRAVTSTLALMKAGGGYPLDGAHWPLFLAQIIIPALAFVGIFKMALHTIRRDTRVLLAQRLKDHVIVCGLGDTGHHIVEGFRDAGLNVVALALDGSSAHAAAAERRGAVVLEGDANQHGMLRLARVRHARSLILTTGSDGSNLEIGMRAREILAGARAHRLTILAELRSEWLNDLIGRHGAGTLGNPHADFRLFDLNSNAARALLRENTFLRAVPEAAPRPHLLFLGFGSTGTQILSRAIRCNFALPGQRLSATIVDRRADAIAPLRDANPGLSELADIACRPGQFSADDNAWQGAVNEALNANLPLSVIVALGADDVALLVATKVRAMLDASGHFATPVFVRLRRQHRLGHFVAQLESRSLLNARLLPFGGLPFLTSPSALLDESLDILAKASHDIWLSQNTQTDSPAAVPWDRLAEFYKQANRALADYVPVRLRACGLRLSPGRGPLPTLDQATVEKLATLEHWRWCTELKALGWRYSETRDDFLKLHNRLVSWEDLPDSTRAYNREAARQLPQIADMAGMSIRRDLIVFAGEPLPQTLGERQLVIAMDATDTSHWQAVQDAVKGGAKLWLMLPDDAVRQTLQRLPTDACTVEMLLSEEEYAALKAAR